MKSDCDSARASAQMMRAAPAQPKHPSMANVISTEIIGETFRGKSARTVINKKSHGSERKRSVPAITQRSTRPPANPAMPPMQAANKLDSKAVGGDNKIENRGPHNT